MKSDRGDGYCRPDAGNFHRNGSPSTVSKGLSAVNKTSSERAVHAQKRDSIALFGAVQEQGFAYLTSEQMFTILRTMSVEINDPIKVAAVFSCGEIRPVWFAWKGRQIRVSETTFTWKTREGSAKVLHFSVTDGQGLYEICYNAESLGWRIMNAE